jgi:anaerobic C4-dicarboxylate transporter
LIVAGHSVGGFCRSQAPSSSPSLFWVSIAWGLIVAGFSIASFWPYQAQKRAPESRELLSALATDKTATTATGKNRLKKFLN